jgi:hypothetical protein
MTDPFRDLGIQGFRDLGISVSLLAYSYGDNWSFLFFCHPGEIRFAPHWNTPVKQKGSSPI